MTPGGPKAARSLYVHVPHCRSLCGYCDYDVAPLADHDPARFVQTLAAEIVLRSIAEIRPCAVLIGGGTPTALPVEHLARLLRTVRDTFAAGHVPDEWTVEANPEDVTPECVRVLAGAGVTRCSLGVQSLQPRALAALGRLHTREQALAALDLAGEAGLTLSVDLLNGLPGARGPVAADVETLMARGVGHVSVFGPGSTASPFDVRNLLLHHGLQRYELTSFARPGAEGRHQVATFRGEPGIGVGPAAAGWLDGVRRVNTRAAGAWARQVSAGEDPVGETDRPGGARGVREDAMARLHLAEGFAWQDLEARWGGIDPRAVLEAAVAELTVEGLLAQRADGRIALTALGMDRADHALARILAGPM